MTRRADLKVGPSIFWLLTSNLTPIYDVADHG
jgi:hypothetical protein